MSDIRTDRCFEEWAGIDTSKPTKNDFYSLSGRGLFGLMPMAGSRWPITCPGSIVFLKKQLDFDSDQAIITVFPKRAASSRCRSLILACG